MEENPPLEEINQQLKIQNLELAQRLQFWRIEYTKLQNDKLSIVKENSELICENNRYRDQLLKFRSIENIIKQSLTHSLTDIVKGSEQIRQILDVLNVQPSNNEALESSCSPKRTSNQSSVLSGNVNHVHPMIRGITIKKPVIRISRAVFEPVEPLASLTSESLNDIEEDAENTSREDSTPPQQVEMLDLCVSLCRVDSPSRLVNKTPKKVFPSPSRTSLTRNDVSNPDYSNLQNQNIPENSEEATPEDRNENNVFIDESKESTNFLPDGSFEYRSRLECVIEESDSIKWSSSPKLNPFVALSRTLDENNSKSIQKSQLSNTEEDPLEGPSWRFDNVSTRRDIFVSTRKRKKMLDENLARSDKIEDAQLPDSTTNGSIKDNSSGDHSIFDKTFPSVPDYQSTPILVLPNITKNVHKSTESIEPSATADMAETETELKVKNHLLNAKVLLSKMEKKPPTQKRTRKKQSNSKRTSSTEKHLDGVTPPKQKRESQTSGSPSSRGSTVLFRSSSESSFSTRPRRGQTKNYKEKPLNKKLRRNGNDI